MAGKDSVREENHSVGATSSSAHEGGCGQAAAGPARGVGLARLDEWNAALSERRTIVTPLHAGIRTDAARRMDRERARPAAFLARFIREQRPRADRRHRLLVRRMARRRDGRQRSQPVLEDRAGRAGRHPSARGRNHGSVHGAGAGLSARIGARCACTPEFARSIRRRTSPEQYEAFEDARAETARIAWQPYMFNPSLPHLLEGTVKSSGR